MRYLCCLLFFLVTSASSAQTGKFCFASAETFYEQVYCQLQAKAQIKDLPPFHEFRKNPERVQYSLLKRPAERNAIKLPEPVKPVQTNPSPAVAASPKINNNTAVARASGEAAAVAVKAAVVGGIACDLAGKTLTCGNQKFLLSGNKANHRLENQALSPDNKMDLPTYSDGDLNRYLAKAYERYIFKMDEIGLGGVTMTYGKFAYLYQDLLSKGLNFSQRFETMFAFLKKDKAALGVSEAVNLPQGFNVNTCMPLGEQYAVCDFQGRNYIFQAR